VLAGFMTHMCVSSTRDLPVPGGTPVPAATLQTATLAGIADLFAVVVGRPDDIPG
jgi:hypothetical protein